MSRHDSREIENVKVVLVKGDSGSTIVSIEKTGTSGLVDTYTITMSDGSKSTFTVSNGKEIVSVEKTGTSGLVDTYTMTFNDESTETFEVINGNGIASIEKTGTQGAVDTYTITLDDGTTYTFTVTNATGTVDSDFSETSENPVQNKVITNKINAMDDNIAGTEDGSTASQTYVAGEFILRNNQLYKVTTAIATGDALTVGVNISADSVGEELERINTNANRINSDLSNLYKVSIQDNFVTGYVVMDVCHNLSTSSSRIVLEPKFILNNSAHIWMASCILTSDDNGQNWAMSGNLTFGDDGLKNWNCQFVSAISF